MQRLDPQQLRSFILFQDLAEADLKRVASISRRRAFPKGHTIFLEGERGDYVVFIASGLVRISRVSSEGKVKTLAILRAPDFFGEMAVFHADHERSATAETLTECNLITIERDDFERLLEDFPSISRKIIAALTQRLRAMNEQVKILALGGGLAKLANLLLSLNEEFAGPNGPSPAIPLSHQELANLAGLSRETTTRLLNVLEAKGALRLKSRQVEIADVRVLRKHAA